MNEVIYKKRGIVAAIAIVLATIGSAQFHMQSSLLAINPPVYAQNMENTTASTASSEVASSQPQQKQPPPNQESVIVTPGLSTDDLNTNTQPESSDISENGLQNGQEQQPKVSDQQQSAQNNELSANLVQDGEGPVEKPNQQLDDTVKNSATQNEETEGTQQSVTQRNQPGTEDSDAKDNRANLDEENTQGEEEGNGADDSRSDNNNDEEDDEDDEDEEEDTSNNDIPLEYRIVPFP